MTPILFLCWNRLAYSKICFSGLISHIEPLHIVIADNGSTDGTKEWIEEIKNTRSVHEIEVWEFNRNYGRFRVNNLFFDRMIKRGFKYVGFIFNDVVSSGSWVLSFKRFLDDVPNVGLVFPAPEAYRGHDPSTTENGHQFWNGNMVFMSDGFGLIRSKVFTDRIEKGKFPYLHNNMYGCSEGQFIAEIKEDGWTTACSAEEPLTFSTGSNGDQEYKKHVILVKRRYAVDPLRYQADTGGGVLTWKENGEMQTWKEEPWVSRRAATAVLTPLELKAELDPGVSEGDASLVP